MQADECPETAKLNIRRMLDARGIPGTDVTITHVHDCPGFMWGMRRGADWAVVVVQTVSKSAAMAIFDYCHPPEPVVADDAAAADPDHEDPPPHPHAGNNVTHCVVVYRDKCTVIAGKEIAAYRRTAVEKFSVEEVMICPLDTDMQAEYTLLSDADATAICDKYGGRKNMASIWTTDPVNRYFHAPLNSVFRTVERWGTLQPEVKYRVVTNPSA
jgi:DNA-directed RNA polymerase subunit H (RpoH/RPB5)